MRFTEADRVVMKAAAQTAINQMLKHFMDAGAGITPGKMFGIMVWQLAFARVLEEQLLGMFSRCPDRELAREMEQLSADIAAAVLKRLKEAAPK